MDEKCIGYRLLLLLIDKLDNIVQTFNETKGIFLEYIG